MSKHKKDRPSSAVERNAQANVDKIKEKTKTQKTSIKDLPSWSQDLAYRRFGLSEVISFIPLIIAVLVTPMLNDRVPMGGGLVVNKNALFIIPFVSLLISGGSYVSIKIRRKAEQVTDIEHLAWNEIFAFLANVLVVVVCSAVLIYQLFRAFTA
ncbi:hypothetical protein SIN07_08705 [Pediococcus inopinatus]|uniref:Integral membrane protein n=1 Tax=Pediococcus inopinatus TaxID=114090 RepID=A0ABZ0Q5X9_9LACO|nr:hypothetical protein [Pediococcus inopinatus]AVK99249.1 hypothetical protein PI20285_00490 [Pediococcus inopinatus]KRN60602.1 hypothetical protein IV83_GL001438 [Pediococcus inopinatus]WPC20288.1 hypothetical protein N6G95_03635 [Pediococcus inopinatus]WPC21993.1 hypothetical protein N6G96_01895 [Pediococcus inopinatus]WPP09077.1 hypothetical protein SIN07_08705 [Pediococcus inopinatus]